MMVIKNASLRRFLRYFIPFFAIPAAVLLGAFAFDAKRYAFIIIMAAFLAMLLFIAGYEKKSTGTRRLMIAAVMTALCVVGRFIPFFKPVTALTIITAMYLGGETGFLVGSAAAALSNFYFGQGPWTPFQMLAWGLTGLLAGMLSPVLRRSRAVLLTFGFIAGAAFSLVMDVWTVLWYNDAFDASLYIAALVTALPHTLLYSVSNVLFLWLAAKPFGEKLARVKYRYGI